MRSHIRFVSAAGLLSILSIIILSPGESFSQAVGPEFLVNTYTTDSQGHPIVSYDQSGNFIVVWESRDQDGSGWGVYAQRFSGSGSKIGPEFLVNTNTLGDQLSPYVSHDGSGNYVVVWQSQLQDGDGYGIYGQRFDNSDSMLGSEFLVNTYTTGDQIEPRVSCASSGSFAVVWESKDQDGSGGGIYCQMFAGNGTTYGSELLVNTYTTGDQSYPCISHDQSDGFVVAWQSMDQDGDDWGVFGQRFDTYGAKAGPEFQANTFTTEIQLHPRICHQSGGGFVIVWWNNRQEGIKGGDGVYGQRFDPSGVKLGQEIHINTYIANDQNLPSVASDQTGNFTVVWQSEYQDGSWEGVFGQRFDSAGNMDGIEFQVNTTTYDNQWRPDVAYDPSGNFVVVWKSMGTGENVDDIFGQRFEVTAVATLFSGISAAAGGEGIEIFWDLSTHENVSGFDIYRRIAGEPAGNAAINDDLLPPLTCRYVDRDVKAGRKYIYEVCAVGGDGFRSRSQPVTVSMPAPPTSLRQNYPNPFNPSTNIAFGLSGDADITLRIYDASGRLVRVLAEGRREAGAHIEVWDGMDESGRPASSGVYFYRLRVGRFGETKKMILLQ
jgi:hypothetical protein